MWKFCQPTRPDRPEPYPGEFKVPKQPASSLVVLQAVRIEDVSETTVV